jgi:hypothetical protein
LGTRELEEIVHDNQELHDLDCSPYTIQALRTSRRRWAGHVARMEERRDGFDG